MSPNAFSEVHKPSVFARVSPLLLVVLFSGICKPPKTQTRIWFCVRAETLEPFSVKTKETAVVFAQLVLFLSFQILFPHKQWLGLNEPLQSANTTKLNLNVSEKKVVSLQQIPSTFGGMSRYVELLTLYNFVTRKPE